jgi:glutamine synthetase
MVTDQLAAASATDILHRVDEDGVELVHLQFVDITGTLKGITIPATQLSRVVETGKWFDGSAIDAFARIAESDMYLWPDLSTYTALPWKTGAQRTARLLCWIRTPQGEPFLGDPRGALARVMHEAAEQGYRFSTAVEVEFFLLSEGTSQAPRGQAGYFGVSPNGEEELVEEAVMALRCMGASAVSYHHEVAPSQHEVDFEVDDVLRAADNVITLKYVLKALAPRRGMRVTFMPKPWEGLDGSGMHTHQRLDGPPGTQFSGSPDDEYGLSDLAHSFIAGQLYHGRGMCALIAPLVNSYKRFVAGYEAPVYLSWARHNRSAFIRVPQLAENAEETSLELRAPDSSCNPYLAFAAMLGCGLDGIRGGLPLLPPVEETLYGFDGEEMRRQSGGAMPSSLGEALEAMEADPVVQQAIGEYLSSRFLEIKSLEWRTYLEHVGNWEVERYLDL